MTSQHATQRRTGRRPGFTLVELLVVILILGILAALLVPAVYRAVVKAQNAAIALEVGNLAAALEQYKAKYGDYPPSFAGAGNAQEILNSHLNAHFRRRDPTADVPSNITDLDPSTALHLFLRGFSPDPMYPLTGKGARQPLFEFARDRLRTSNGSLIERLDTDEDVADTQRYYQNLTVYRYLPPRVDRSPYIYFRHDDYGSVWADSNPNGAQGTARAMAQTQPGGGDTTPVEPDKFQIISSGLDDDYGNDTSSTFPVGPYEGNETGRPMRDNITSFSGGGTLEDEQE